MTITVTKNLITQEDIAYGEDTVTQTRDHQDYVLPKVRNIMPVNSLVELNALDPAKFPKAILYSTTAEPVLYQYIGGVWVSRATQVNTYANLATTSAVEGQQIYIKGHTNVGVGEGWFVAKTTSLPTNTGSISASATPGIQWHRRDPKKTPYEFGFIDGGVDVSVALQACTNAYGACYVDAGKTYNIQYQVAPLVLQCIGGIATFNATSPTGNTRFGGLNAVFFPFGTVGAPLKGVDIRGIEVNCNALIGNTGSTGIKGFIFSRLDNFYQRSCLVRNSASYGFWDTDTSETGTTYCSGTRDDCWAYDCSVSFEQVNVRNVTLNNCKAIRTNAALGYSVECLFHPYGGSDMQLAYNNCYGYAEGQCPTIYLALLTCKNVKVNACEFVNNWVSVGQVAAAIYFETASGSYDGHHFTNCILKSSGSLAAWLSPGGNAGTASNVFKFTNCIIEGAQIGVQFNGIGGIYSFTDCNVKGTAAGAVQPFAYYSNATTPTVQVTRGTATATGGAVGPSSTNLSSSIYLGTILSPVGAQRPSVRQEVTGRGVFGGDGSTYANFNINLPTAVNGWNATGSLQTTKYEVVVNIDYTASGATTFPQAVAMAYPLVFALPANNICRVVGNTALNGKTMTYTFREYE